MPITLSTPPRSALDPLVAAFCSPGGPEVFSGIVQGSQIWADDPFDVDSIHTKARDAFQHLLNRASDEMLPDTGKTLLLLGEAGSGKTHLMRAFRTMANRSGSGYCGYLQLTTRTNDYARYVLGYLIDSLDHPYQSRTPQTGLQRLAQGLLDSLDIASETDKQRLIDDTVIESDDLGRLIHRLAHLAVQMPRFRKIHVDVIRTLLYLLSPDARVHQLAMRWLRCEDLDRFDRELLGDLVPRHGAEWPMKTIWDLGRLMHTVSSSALVLLIDQIEEVVDLDKSAEPGETFRQAINALVEVADGLPNAVVVISCLDDLFVKHKQYLPKPKLDRIEQNPEPVRLVGQRSETELYDMVNQRLTVLFDELDLEYDGAPIRIYTQDMLKPLAQLRSRDILDHLRVHRLTCQERREWVDPNWNTTTPKAVVTQATSTAEIAWEQKWNDFCATNRAPVLEDEEKKKLLHFAINSVSVEMPDGIHFNATLEEELISVDIHPGGDSVDQLYVALCDKSTRGGGLGKQVESLVKTVRDIPTVVLRSTEFPKTRQKATTELAKIMKPHGTGRKHVVSDSDWRTMAAFREFSSKYSADAGFRNWQKTDQPLAVLPTLIAILELKELFAKRPVNPQRQSLPPAPQDTPLPAGPVVGPKHSALEESITLGVTRGTIQNLVELPANVFCRHAAFLGGSGSGKTTAVLAIIEQLLLSGIPAVLIDRKGDLSRYADPEAWTTNDNNVERRKLLQSKLDIALYTPGNENGRSLSISAVPADLTQLNTADREMIAQYAAASLCLMMGHKSRSPDPRSVILQKAIEILSRVPGQLVTVRSLRDLIVEKDDTLVMELSGYDDKHFSKLGQDLLTLQHQHRRLLEGGEQLNVDELVGRTSSTDKTRLAIINTQFLGEQGTVDFWLSQFLLSVDRWRAKNPSDHLQAVFLFDEADQYLPAGNKQPATKGPMESLLKRARSAGLGIFLATQSPGDLDYRCRDQILTWLIGRVGQKVAIDKLRPMLERRPEAADKLADQKAGQFYLVRESDVSPITTERNLISTEQLPEEKILQLAKLKRR